MNLTDFITRVKLPFCKERELYRSFYRILGFYPRDIRPYKVAMLHRSAAAREEGKCINNERLEFLGDAILSAVVGHIVYKHFPRKSEGFLTNARSNIVQRSSLNKLAKETGFDKLIISNFKAQTHNSYVSGNAFEALIGAIYLDRGYGHCVRFVKERILSRLVNLDKAAYATVNHKSKLLEWGQKHHIEVVFRNEEEKEGNNTPLFRCTIAIADIECGHGKGYSKKESQQNAAKEALERIRKDRDFVLSLTAPKELQMERYDKIAPLSAEEKTEAVAEEPRKEGDVDIDFSDISMKEKSREQIIAEAEARAFAE